MYLCSLDCTLLFLLNIFFFKSVHLSLFEPIYLKFSAFNELDHYVFLLFLSILPSVKFYSTYSYLLLGKHLLTLPGILLHMLSSYLVKPVIFSILN